MNPQIVAFTGISGVGKSTFLRCLAEHIPFQHLTGGSLIATARETHPNQRDAMRHANLDENQQLLIEGFALARDPVANLIFMDRHVAIDNGEGLEELHIDVFRALGITMMVHLEAEPADISANRSGDSSRSRPIRDPTTLARHQDASRAHARFIATELDVAFHVVTHGDVERLASDLTT